METVVAIICLGLLFARDTIASVMRHISDNRVKRAFEKTKQAEFEYETERLRRERTSSTSFEE